MAYRAEVVIEAWQDLKAAICSEERANGRRYTAVIIPHGIEEDCLVSVNGVDYPDQLPRCVIHRALMVRRQ